MASLFPPAFARQLGQGASQLLDHLIRPLQERRRDRQAEDLGRLEVDDKVELGKLLRWEATGYQRQQVGRAGIGWRDRARSGGEVLRDRSSRWAPDQEPRRLVRVGVADAPVLGLTGSLLSKPPNESSQVRQMPERDLAGGSQMLQAVHLDGPRWTPSEDVSDSGFLGAGEHGAAMVAEDHQVGQVS
jgi:hypothetical protein